MQDLELTATTDQSIAYNEVKTCPKTVMGLLKLAVNRIIGREVFSNILYDFVTTPCMRSEKRVMQFCWEIESDTTPFQISNKLEEALAAARAEARNLPGYSGWNVNAHEDVPMHQIISRGFELLNARLELGRWGL